MDDSFVAFQVLRVVEEPEVASVLEVRRSAVTASVPMVAMIASAPAVASIPMVAFAIEVRIIEAASVPGVRPEAVVVGSKKIWQLQWVARSTCG